MEEINNELEVWIKAVKKAYGNKIKTITTFIGSCDLNKYKQIPGNSTEEKARFIVMYGEKTIEKKPINLLFANNSESQDYIDFLSERYIVNVIKHEEMFNNVKIDLILFTGGEDVSTDLYNQKQGKYTSINKKRDNLEMGIFYEFPNTPKLGICRGLI